MSSIAMPSFNFERDVDRTQLKRTLRILDYSSSEIDGLDLQSTLSKVVIEAVLAQASSGYQVGISQLLSYGFKSIEAVECFISQPEVLGPLREGLHAQEPFSNDLMSRVQLTFARAKAEIKDTDMVDRVSGSSVLATLPHIFDLIQRLSDKEVDDIQKRYGAAISSYLAGNSLKEFRDDMTSLPLEKFEEKYSGCFNGMLENVVGSILEHERLLQIVKKEDPLLENDASVSAARNNMHYYKNQVRDLSDEAESKASDSLTRKNFLRK